MEEMRMERWDPAFGPHSFDDDATEPETAAKAEEPIPADPVSFVRDTLGWIPDPNQESILRSKSKRIILCMGRRCGKTYITSAKAAHFAATRPGSEILVFSRSQNQANIVLGHCRSFLRSAGIPVRGSGLNRFSLRLPNSSVIISLPSKEATSRGYTPDLVIMDEAARIPNDVYDAVTPMLGLKNPTLMLLSTPLGTRGFFYDEWISSDPWDRYFVRTSDCPRYDRDHLESERRRKPESVFRREYMCEFLEADGACFPDKLVLRAIFDDPLTTLPRMTRRRDTFIGVDLGRQQDPSTIAVIERLEILSEVRDRITMNFPARWIYRLVYLERLALETPYPEVVDAVCAVTRRYPKSQLVVDATGVGMPVVDLLRAAKPDAILQPIAITGGITANTWGDVHRIPKRDLIARVQLMLESNSLQISNRLDAFDHLRDEMRNFRMKINAKAHDEYGAPEGDHDDLVLALSLAAYKAWRSENSNA